MWGMQGFLPSIPVQRCELPVSPSEELCCGSSKQEQMPVLQATEMSCTRHVQRWWVLIIYPVTNLVIEWQFFRLLLLALGVPNQNTGNKCIGCSFYRPENCAFRFLQLNFHILRVPQNWRRSTTKLLIHFNLMHLQSSLLELRQPCQWICLTIEEYVASWCHYQSWGSLEVEFALLLRKPQHLSLKAIIWFLKCSIMVPPACCPCSRQFSCLEWYQW